MVAPFYGEAPARDTKAYRDFHRLVTQTQVGGLIVLNRVRNGLVVNAEPHAMAAFLNRMQRAAKLPLIVGGDFERGVSMRVAGTTKFPHNMAYGAAGDLEGTRFLGRHTAREARAMGVHWVFAPAADVNNNADNPVISLRSFSENPDDVARHVAAYIEGAHSDPKNMVLVCAKHFPGHGDTAVDSHMALARIDSDRERLNTIELPPFRAAIAAGVDSIMTAHLMIPALEPEPIPVTVSRKVMTDLLQTELGFRGLVTTDAMDMDGLAKQFSPEEAAVRAILAGVDVLLIPPSPERAVDGVVAAVNQGRISRERIRRSVEKILAAKVRLGLHKKRLVDLEEVAEVADSEEASAMAQRTADRALTLVRNENGAFPASKPESACLFVLSENRYSTLGRRLIDDLRGRAPKMRISWIDAAASDAAIESAVASAKACGAAYLAAFAAPSAYRGDSGLSIAPQLTKFTRAILTLPIPTGLVSFGNPYLLRAFPEAKAYVATLSTAPTSEAALAKALVGQIGFEGKLPVTIPGAAAFGQGAASGSGR